MMTPSENLTGRALDVWNQLLPVLGSAAHPAQAGLLEVTCATLAEAFELAETLELEGVIIRAPNGRLQLHPLFDQLVANLERVRAVLEGYADVDRQAWSN